MMIAMLPKCRMLPKPRIAVLLMLATLSGGCAQALCDLRTDKDPYDPEGDRRQCERQVEQYIETQAAEKQKRQDAEQQALLDEALAGRRVR
ncbi:hypothetical protein [Shewanella sp.]|uniref:hypothetical protein n=1 Tax=Shewanella sp. TaxID=50422 RepID=UPI0035676561